jgi:integrase
MFNLAIRWHVRGVQVNPAAHLPFPVVDNQRYLFLSSSQICTLLASLEQSPNPFLRPIAIILLLTGARKREVLGIRWSDLSSERASWGISPGKNGRSRLVPLCDAVLEVLRLRRSADPSSEWVFANSVTSKPFCSVYYSWNAVRISMGLPALRMHDLRHIFASLLVNGGHSLYEVQVLLGHRSPRMTLRYSRLSDSTLALAVADVSAQVFAR